MPRIEIIPQGWAESDEAKRGDGTPTLDVCWSCQSEFVEGDPAPESLADEHPRALVGSTEVAHPPYAEEAYRCEICDDLLTEDDD